MTELPPPSREPLLFTPGPLTTSPTVKQAMLRDVGSRDLAFIEVVREIRDELLKLANTTAGEYEAIPLQGSGTFALEAVLSSCIPPDGKVLIAVNGAYGQRLAGMCAVLNIDHEAMVFREDRPVDPDAVGATLDGDPDVSHVAVVHCETTTGIMNPVEAIGEVVRDEHRMYIVDAMSSFGAVPLDIRAAHIDYLVSSANKCIEGVPGFAFVIADYEALLETEGYARSLSLDLLAQWKGLEANGQFRFTPPTHAMLAFRQALRELAREGGAAGRALRYKQNYETLIDGMTARGFVPYVDEPHRGYIITAFRYPSHPKFSFFEFYERLHNRGFAIYPGKVTDAECFRIGTIGRLFESDIANLLAAIEAVLEEMEVDLTPPAV